MTKEVITEKIRLHGIVQGVGFRPFTAKCAAKYGMRGTVLNIGGLVEIVVTDSPDRIDDFIEAILREKPAESTIVHISRKKLDDAVDFDGFTILESDEGGDEAAMIPADLSICPDCLRELNDPENPRYMHPFISCMACGPRYTIIDRIPYDRDNTSMIDWPMCDFCDEQYRNIKEKRYHAQTVSCHECGPQLLLHDRDIAMSTEEFAMGYVRRLEGFTCACCHEQSPIEKRREINKGILLYVTELLRQGCVVAVKGVGGYNLWADPFNKLAVDTLREIKGREAKPFAVMFRDAEQVREYCIASEAEVGLLESPAKPIMLLAHKTPDEIRSVFAKRCPDAREGYPDFGDMEKSRHTGAFLPSAGFQYMIIDMFGGPVISTSANVSDMPIIKDDAEMFAFMERDPRIAACLYNERDIRLRVDDSVARIVDGAAQITRRSKGYAPVPVFIQPGGEEIDKSVAVFATGGQLKNSFALSKGEFSYVSQYFGDLDCDEVRSIYKENVGRMAEFFRIKPVAVACDMHPLYYTTGFAREYAELAGGLPVIPVQHHHAHIASVMAEHHIDGPVIGVAMDGTGYGTDGNVWGGEFLLCERGDFTREEHLAYVDMIGGDGSMKEAWKSAMCYMAAYDEKRETEKDEIRIALDDIFEFAERNGTVKERAEWPLVRAALKTGTNVIKSSSMGRLFDAVSALLGIKDYNDYEGQCAVMLEDAAAAALRSPGACERNDLALAFHYAVADAILASCRRIASRTGALQVALSGGTFQNKILAERTASLLRADGFSVYFNASVSPNDGGIALGQNYVALCKLKDKSNLR